MKKAYIFGAGEYDSPPPAISAGDTVIAADGGYDYLEKHGIRPRLLMGDMDSLERVPEGVETRRYPVEKDETDMELAVSEALRLGAEELMLFGGLGGRLDHTIANLQLIAGLSRRGIRAYLVSGGTTAAGLFGGTLWFPAGFEGKISVFSFGGTSTGVTLRGLYYPLTDAVLRDDVTLGVSNCFTGADASVTVRNGTLLIIWEGNYGKYPTFTPEVEA